MTVGLPCILLLNAARIRQHELTEIFRAGGAKHPALEPVRNESRKVPDVIQMCVRQDDRVDGIRRHGQVGPIAQTQFLQALKKPAIEKHCRAVVLEQVFRPGDRARCAEKREMCHAETTTISQNSKLKSQKSKRLQGVFGF